MKSSISLPEVVRGAEPQTTAVVLEAEQNEAPATTRLEVLRSAALPEVEALLHDAQARARALTDTAQERAASIVQRSRSAEVAAAARGRRSSGRSHGFLDRRAITGGSDLPAWSPTDDDLDPMTPDWHRPFIAACAATRLRSSVLRTGAAAEVARGRRLRIG